MFQGVHETICYGPSDKPWGENEPRINQIVFIGRNLDRKALMEGFRWGRGAGHHARAHVWAVGVCLGGGPGVRRIKAAASASKTHSLCFP